MAEVILSRLALQDLDDIWDYVAQFNPDAADDLLDQMDQRCQLLLSVPLSGVACTALAENLRQTVVGNYAIFYRPEDENILIVRVLHSRRDIPEIFRAMDTEEE